MFAPTTGDLLLRGSSENGFAVLDAVTDEMLTTTLPLLDALAFARNHGAHRIWQQHLDSRGRGTSQPLVLLPERPSERHS